MFVFVSSCNRNTAHVYQGAKWVMMDYWLTVAQHPYPVVNVTRRKWNKEKTMPPEINSFKNWIFSESLCLPMAWHQCVMPGGWVPLGYTTQCLRWTLFGPFLGQVFSVKCLKALLHSQLVAHSQIHFLLLPIEKEIIFWGFAMLVNHFTFSMSLNQARSRNRLVSLQCMCVCVFCV